MKNKKQIEAFKDPSRFKFILAGRRGGKTFLIKHDILETMRRCPPYGEIWYIGPNNQQSKELMWSALDEAAYEQGWHYKPMVSKSRFEFSRSRMVYIVGAEKISRIRGHAVYKAYLDELAFFQTDLNEVWKAVRPTLTDFGGQAWACTTPNGKGTSAHEFYLASLAKKNWKYFHWRTIDNPWIDPKEIDEAKTELDEKGFAQEYLAEWQSYEGLAYYNFSENTHIETAPDIDIALPLHLCFDFNVNPTTLLLSQKHGDKLFYKKEYSFKNSSTEDTIQAFCDDFELQRPYLNIKIRGDASGSSRSANTGKSDYYYIEQILNHRGFNFQKEVRPANPPIIDRVKILNGWLKPVVGSPKLAVDPSCRELIKDLSSQELNGRTPSDANNMGHKADACGYDVYWEHLVSSRKTQSTIRL